MKILNILFFHVYNAYYKDGNYYNDVPHVTAFGIVGSSLSMLLTSILLVILRMLSIKPTYNIVLVILVGSLLLLSYFFLFKKKYKVIYNLIKNSKWDNLRFKIISWVTIFLGFISIGVYGYIFNR